MSNITSNISKRIPTREKLNALLEYVNNHNDEQYRVHDIVHLVIERIDYINTLKFNDYVYIYKYKTNIVNPQPLAVIKHFKELREPFTETLDYLLNILDVKVEPTHNKTILDELIEKKNKEIANTQHKISSHL